jgi:hypothetical protein
LRIGECRVSLSVLGADREVAAVDPQGDEPLNMLGYWKVLKSQKRVVIIGVLVSIAVATLAMFRISSGGVSMRSPAVYEAKSTLLVKAGASRDGVPTVAPEYQAQIFAELADGDAVRRMIDPTRKRELAYSVDPVSGASGPLPLITVTAFSPDQRAAMALSNRVGAALTTYVASTQQKLPPARRTTLSTVARADEATVFSGARKTPAMMLFVLGISGTVFLAFTRHNLRLARRLEVDDDAPGQSTSEPAHSPRHDDDQSTREAGQVQSLERVAAARERKKAPGGTLSG